MNSEDIIRTPKHIKRLEDVCPECRTQSIMEIYGKTYCGECDLRIVKSSFEKRIEDHYSNNPDPLGKYYLDRLNDKKPKKDRYHE